VRAASLDPLATLEAGRDAYQRRQYARAEELVRPLLYPRVELAARADVLEAHKLLALSSLFSKREPEARQEVVALLALDPDFQLDQFVEPPQAVAFFEAVRRDQEERLREFRRRQREEEERRQQEEQAQRTEARRRAERITIEKTITPHSRLLALVPFGVGQWQNGHRRRAIAFAATELLLGAVSLGAWAAIEARYPARTVPAADVSTARALLGTQLGAGAAFWGLVVSGIIEAQVHYTPSTVMTRELAASGEAR
jgi:hypothetical protein